MAADVTSEQLADAERFLRELALPEDRTLLDDGQQVYKISDLVGWYALDEGTWRAAAARGDIPFAFMPTQQTGWRLPRSGVIWYVAQLRRQYLDLTQRDHG